jgi:hypothetical protein
VGQLVREQPPALVRVGLQLAGAEHDVRAVGVRTGVERLRGGRSIGTRVQAHVREIGAQPRLEEAAHPVGQRLASPSERRNGGWRDRAAGCGLGLDHAFALLVFARGAHAVHAQACVRDRRAAAPRHGIGHAVGFSLGGITRPRHGNGGGQPEPVAVGGHGARIRTIASRRRPCEHRRGG